MICTPEQVKDIILNNPNKSLIEEGKKQAEKLLLHVHGERLQGSLKQYEYFENPDIFKERTRDAVSNKDLFARLLQPENMVFTSQGGFTDYSGLTQPQKDQLTTYLDNVRFGMTLRKWIQQFALDAYRCDPMGLIYIEVNQNKQPYPTYKSSSCVYDYQPNGRRLEYLCFQLSISDVKELGINDDTLGNAKEESKTQYYRLIDDSFDAIYKNTNGTITEYQKLRIQTQWGQVPAILASNIPAFNNPNKFISPLDNVIELAETYLKDRSIRDLQKKYSGFYKTIEPLLRCERCGGEGFVSGAACPECTPMGSDRGTGYKLRTKVADVARFPMDKDMPNPSSFFAYIGAPVDTWNKQDSSLNDIENLIHDVYWGTQSRDMVSNPSGQMDSLQETATKTLSNLQPKYAKLNFTADWAQSTENAIVDFIGSYMYQNYKKANITYGRFYILESPNELSEDYLNKKAKGAPEADLTDSLKRYYHSLYKENPVKLTIALKMINVEPFIHKTTKEVKELQPEQIDYLRKLYFSEWITSLRDDYLIITPEDKLKAELTAYANTKKPNDTTAIPGAD